MADLETDCPECSGAGFFGNSGPIVEKLCDFCKGTGVLVEGQAYRFLPKKPVALALSADGKTRSEESAEDVA